MVPATIACCARTCPCQLPVADKFRAPSSSPSPCTSPETTNCPLPRMSPTNTEFAPMNVGLAELLSRNRRFCWLMTPFLSYRDSPWCDELGVAARWRIEVECTIPINPLECENGHQASVFGPVHNLRTRAVRVQPPAERLGENPGREHHRCL